MKKPLIIALKAVGIIILVYTLLGMTNVFKMYNIPTVSNEPGIKLNSYIFASNLVDFDNGDFVCYKYNDEIFGKQIWVHRLLGKSGDIVEIKNGILYLNDKNVDESLELNHAYLINTAEYQDLKKKNVIDENSMLYQSNDQVFVFLLDVIAEQNGLTSKIKLHENDQTDNFGPIKVPAGKCFVIGDNRHNSQDSRMIGLIDKSDIVGTVLWK